MEFHYDLPRFQSPNSIDNAKLLLERSNTGDENFYKAMKILKTLSNENNAEAQLLLANVFMQKGAIENATQHAFDIFNKLTAQGHPLAMEGLADLHMWGVGIEQNFEKSFQIYNQLAQMGYVPMTTLAYLYSQGIGTVANEIKASSLLLKSAAQGDTLAFILLADRYIEGLGVPFNPTVAAAFATLAVKRQFPGAQSKLNEILKENESVKTESLDSIVNQLISGIESLADHVDLLSKQVPPQSPQFAEKYLELLNSHQFKMEVSDVSFNEVKRGYEYNLKPCKEISSKILSQSPKVKVIDDLASYEECQYLIHQTLPFLVSTRNQKHVNPHIEVDAFTGASAIFSATRTSPVSRRVQQRYADICGVSITNFEPVSVIRYQVGDEYSLHTDAFDEERIKSHEKICDFGGQRLTTNLIYLLPPESGGETEYVKSNLSLNGKTGMGIMHHNALDDGTPDPNSLHIGKEIKSGEKWLLRTATREFPLYANNRVPLNPLHK